ncbi:MAG: DUF3429 domain-containing protein [Pseudomonadota bacterium]
MKQLSPATRWLGLAGLLPALGCLAIAWLDFDQDTRLISTAIMLLYGAVILSFIGGAWWGLVSRHQDAPGWGVLTLSVIPSLYAWPSVAWAWIDAAYAGAAWLLSLGFLLTLLVDRLLANSNIAPKWWMTLRLPLSLGMGACFFALGMRFFF